MHGWSVNRDAMLIAGAKFCEVTTHETEKQRKSSVRGDYNSCEVPRQNCKNHRLFRVCMKF
jgi:hypothetical protein